MAQTVGDLINLAMKQAGVLGVGQTLSAEDSNDAFTLLNMMLAQWQIRRWLVWGLMDVSFQANGAQSYTLGPGADFNTPYVDRLESAYFRYQIPSGPSQEVDFPLTILQSYEDYGRLRLKQLESFPQFIFYDSAFPVGNVYVWPIPPTSQYYIHLLLKTQIGQFSALTETFTLPPQYLEAVLYNLAMRLRPMYQLPADMQLNALAADALVSIRNSNSQIPRLVMPRDLTGNGGWYNPFSDRIT